MNIITIIGARPQFIKAAMVSRAIAAHNQRADRDEIKETIIHTGQHYDTNMSEIFFRELNIPAPEVNLNIGSGSHGDTTGRMLAAIEKELMHRRLDRVLVYGDTNSTLAGALAAAKLNIPVAHAEAGLRSFNRRMPEEINRVMTDHLSDMLFCPSPTAVENLAAEGITQSVHLVGDVMYEALMHAVNIADIKSHILTELELNAGEYVLSTIHRAENTDNPPKLKELMKALVQVSQKHPVIFPLHPRTRDRLDLLSHGFPALKYHGLRLLEPVGYLDMVQLEKNAKVILTDSGGIQKEAYWLQVPCVTLREETEWVETVDQGWNVLTGTDPDRILPAVLTPATPDGFVDIYQGNGSVERILQVLLKKI